MKINIDAKGLKCPEPIMLLHKAIRESNSGDLIYLTATDKSTERDVDKFCKFSATGEIGKDDFRFFISICNRNCSQVESMQLSSARCIE